MSRLRLHYGLKIGTKKQLKHSELLQKESAAPADSDAGFMGGEGLHEEREKRKRGRSSEPGNSICGFLRLCATIYFRIH